MCIRDRTYTYKLRDDAKWYDSEGEEYADVTAKDFVTGIKYAADNKSEMLYIIQDSIKGLNDYVSGKNKDFSAVGVKAVDDHTLQITLNQPESYWNSKLDVYKRQVVGSELRPGNIWENIELPRLKANPNVTKVTTIDPKTGVEKIIFER